MGLPSKTLERLKKAVYGLKQAAKEWQAKVANTLETFDVINLQSGLHE